VREKSTTTTYRATKAFSGNILPALAPLLMFGVGRSNSSSKANEPMDEAALLWHQNPPKRRSGKAERIVAVCIPKRTEMFESKFLSIT
jgi:hypothetical protein